jgi:hypothetical protein
VRWVPQRQLRSFSARFAGITHLGHVVTCSGVVVEIVETVGERCARVEVLSTNQYGETRIAGEALIALS